MFNQGWHPEHEGPAEGPKKQPVRFAPKVIAQIYGKQLPEIGKDRLFDDDRKPNTTKNRFKDPKPKKQPQPPKPAKQPKQKAMLDFQIDKASPPAEEAGNTPDGIQGTKNYRRFKFLPTNRPVDPAHVNALAAKIRVKNLLNLNPIIVNTRFEIIEGQHRLKAAEKLGVKIYYIQDDEVTQDDIASLNSNRKAWVLKDYIHFFAQQHKDDYNTFLAFCKEFPAVNMATLLGLCSENGNVKRAYKDGQIDISGMERARETLGYLADFDEHTQHSRSTHFIKALSFLVRSGEYDHEHMKNKLRQQPGAIMPSPAERGYIETLQRIYNFRMRDDSLVIFLKRI